jgi:hypothetical protein
MIKIDTYLGRNTVCFLIALRGQCQWHVEVRLCDDCKIAKSSVADPGCLSRIRDVYIADPGCLSRIRVFSHPGSRISDPGSQKNMGR